MSKTISIVIMYVLSYQIYEKSKNYILNNLTNTNSCSKGFVRADSQNCFHTLGFTFNNLCCEM